MNLIKKSYLHTYAPIQRAAIDLSLSENPLGPSPKVAEAIINAIETVYLYPSGEKELIRLIAKHHHIPESAILLGAGANQLLEDFLKVFALRKMIVAPTATFPEAVACMSTLEGSVHSVPLHADLRLNVKALLQAVDSNTAFIHLCNPNNPTGIWTDPKKLFRLADRSPVPLLISEAGADFVGKTMIKEAIHPNIVIIRSFSKAYGLAGLRIGYGIADPAIISTMKLHLRSYRLDSLAIAAAVAAIQDQAHLRQSVAYLLREKEWLMRQMGALGFKAVPSQGQTFIARLPELFADAGHFCLKLKAYGAAVVNCSLYPCLNRYVRISPQKREINRAFILILKKIIGVSK